MELQFLFLLSLLLVGKSDAGGKSNQSKPNFVVLFVDDMGIDQIAVPHPAHFHGYTGNNGTIQTPHIARLAAEGLLFQNWYSAYHICSPSRAAMMTGRLPIRSGCVPGVFYAAAVGGLPANETTLPEALRPAGYRSMAIGKWHLGSREQFLPTNRGFDAYLGIPFSQDMGMSWFNDCANFHHSAIVNGSCDPTPHNWNQPTPLPLFHNLTVVAQPAGLYTLTERYARAAVAFMEQSADAHTPFFLYVPFNHVHAPQSCSARSCGKSQRGKIGDAVIDVDLAVGRIMDSIRADHRLAHNTLVFFTSDNGSPLAPDGNLPLRGFKTEIWEGGFREPGIAWWPGKIPAGSHSSTALVATYDIFPTLINLAGKSLLSAQSRVDPQLAACDHVGAKLPGVAVDGIDLTHLLLSDKPDDETAHQCILFYHHPMSQLGPEGAAAVTSLSAIRCGDHKVSGGGGHERMGACQSLYVCVHVVLVQGCDR